MCFKGIVDGLLVMMSHVPVEEPSQAFLCCFFVCLFYAAIVQNHITQLSDTDQKQMFPTV